MQWKKAAKQAKTNKDFIDNRYKIYSTRTVNTKQESTEDFLNRGGKINYINTGVQKMKNITETIENKINKIMTASEAATIAKQDPLLTTEQLMTAIPQYKAALPRRSWIAKFLKLIDPQDTRFINLK